MPLLSQLLLPLSGLGDEELGCPVKPLLGASSVSLAQTPDFVDRGKLLFLPGFPHLAQPLLVLHVSDSQIFDPKPVGHHSKLELNQSNIRVLFTQSSPNAGPS